MSWLDFNILGCHTPALNWRPSSEQIARGRRSLWLGRDNLKEILHKADCLLWWGPLLLQYQCPSHSKHLTHLSSPSCPEYSNNNPHHQISNPQNDTSTDDEKKWPKIKYLTSLYALYIWGYHVSSLAAVSYHRTWETSQNHHSWYAYSNHEWLKDYSHWHLNRRTNGALESLQACLVCALELSGGLDSARMYLWGPSRPFHRPHF